MTEIIAIVVFVYIGIGLLLALHVGATHLSMRSVTNEDDEQAIEAALDWFDFVYNDEGGVWRLMAKLIIRPWYFVKIEEETYR